MGPCGGGVPGNQADSPYVTETCVNDHTGAHASEAATCAPIDDIDQGCVDRILTSNRELGPWTLTNQCQAFAAAVLEECGPKGKRNDGAEGASSR